MHRSFRGFSLLAAAVGITAASVLGGAQIVAPAALADPLPPLDRCLQNTTPDATQTVTHHGNEVGVSFPSDTNPPNGIFPGDVVKVTITGKVRIDYWGNEYGPNGATPDWQGSYWKSRPDANYPFPALNPFSSVARWNNNPGGWVGDPMHTTSLGSCTSAPNVPVRLTYYINDSKLSDNGGQWTIRTDVYRATTTCAPGFFYAWIYGCIPRPV